MRRPRIHMVACGVKLAWVLVSICTASRVRILILHLSHPAGVCRCTTSSKPANISGTTLKELSAHKTTTATSPTTTQDSTFTTMLGYGRRPNGNRVSSCYPTYSETWLRYCSLTTPGQIISFWPSQRRRPSPKLRISSFRPPVRKLLSIPRSQVGARGVELQLPSKVIALGNWQAA